MEATRESYRNIKTCWNILDEAEEKAKSFNPFGIVSDEARAFQKSALEYFDQETNQDSVSCEFHSKENVIRQCSSLASEKDKIKFKMSTQTEFAQHQSNRRFIKCKSELMKTWQKKAEEKNLQNKEWKVRESPHTGPYFKFFK